MKITITLTETVTKRLGRIQGRLRTMSQALQGPIAADVRRYFADQFATAGAHGGRPWAPLSPATLARRPGHLGPLMRTGRLWRSLTEETAPYAYAVLSQRPGEGPSITIGTRDPVVRMLVPGSQDGRLPARDIVGDPQVSGADKRWAQLLADYLLEPGVME